MTIEEFRIEATSDALDDLKCCPRNCNFTAEIAESAELRKVPLENLCGLCDLCGEIG